jgi:hypothetical protein
MQEEIACYLESCHGIKKTDIPAVKRALRPTLLLEVEMCALEALLRFGSRVGKHYSFKAQILRRGETLYCNFKLNKLLFLSDV